MEERLKVGIIASPHGLKGEVKVFPTTDDAKRFKKLKEVVLDTGTELKTLVITGLKFSGKFVVLKFAGIDRIDEAEKLRGMSLMVERKDAVKLRRDEYFIADLLDMAVIGDDGLKIGIITDVIQTGANDVYVVSGDEGREVLLPAIKDCILNIDVENRLMRVYLMDGLLG